MASDRDSHYDFYSPWPALGKRFSGQLQEIRDDTNALHPIVRFSATYDKDEDGPRESRLRGWEYGDRTMHNRFRTISDTDNKWKIQVNRGTEANPFWSTVFSVDSNLSVDTTSFYIPSIVKWRETDGSPSIDADTLIFNSGYFYLTRSSSGKPIVNTSCLRVRDGRLTFNR